MKKITLFILLLSVSFSFSQVVLTEDFEAGLTIPASWTNNDIAGNGEIWTIETGGEAALLTAGNTNIYTSGQCEGNYAAFDSDAYGDNMLPEEAALESPVFDCSGLTSVTLSYTHYFAGNYGGSGFVEVNNGSGWTTVETYTADGYSGGMISLDVTSELAGSATAQVRFRWTGNWSVAWYVDNISVYQCTVTAPAAATVVAPANGATNIGINYGATARSLGPIEWADVPEADSYNISFGTNLAGDNIGRINGATSGITVNYTWAANTIYYWFVESVNCAGVTSSSVWSFTTEACTAIAAPSAASSPVPENGAIDVAINASDNGLSFSWTGDENDTFSLVLGTENPPTQVFNNFENGGTIIGLDENTTYYWAVVSGNCFDVTESPVWSFTTGLALSVDDLNKNNFTHFYSTNDQALTMQSSNAAFESIVMYNLLGQQVISKNLSQTTEVINMSSLKNGIYLAKVTLDGRTQTIKIIKN